MSSAQIPAAPRPQVPTLEVPDLVVPKPAPSRPTPLAKPAPLPSDDAGDLDIDLGAVTSEAPPPKAPITTATDHDPFEDDLSAGPALELDTGGGSLPPRFSPSAPIPPPIAAVPPPPSQRSLGAAPPAASSGAPPEPAPAPQPKPAVDPFEAKALSDYGPPPTEIWRAPQYAYRVLTRRGELVRLLAQKRVLGETTARRAEDGFVSFGERAREVLERTGGRGLEQVLAAEQVLRGRDGALAGAMDAHKAELAEVDARLGTAEGQLVRARQEESRLTALYEAADEDRKRADAKLKRLDIEIRNGADPNARAAERSALAAELAASDAKLADSQIKLTVGQQATKASQTQVGTLRTERQSVEQRFARQVGTRSTGVEEARGQVRAALVALGRAMMTDAATPELDTARAEVARLDEEAQAAAKQVAMHEAALGAYDVGKVALGVGLAVAALVLLVVLVLFPFIYRAIIS